MVGNIGMLDKKIQEILNLNIGSLAGVQGGLVSASGERSVKSVLVTSCNRQEGKTLTAVSMATALANQSGAHVVLVDGNLQAPMIHKAYNVSPDPGFADVISSRASLEEGLRKTGDDSLVILPIGAAPEHLAGQQRSGEIAGQLQSVGRHFDYVIYDGPSIFEASDPSTIAKHFDGIVLVVECERTRWEVAHDAKERLINAGGTLLGVVLNKRQYYIPKAFYGRG
jgi:capsular exopolysaccharide synthesis family protein